VALPELRDSWSTSPADDRRVSARQVSFLPDLVTVKGDTAGVSITERAPVVPAVVGLAAFDRGLPSLRVGVALLAEKIRFEILPAEPGAGSRIDLRHSDIVSVLWTSSRAGLSQRADVLLTSRSQDPVQLRLSCPWYSSEIERLRLGLFRALPPETLLVQEGRAIPVRPVAVIAALAVLTAVGIGAARHEAGRQAAATGATPPAASGPVAAGGAQAATQQTQGAPAEAPGYLRLTGLGGRPLAVGRPWGHACVTEQVVLNGEVSQAIVTATFDVLNVAQQVLSLMMTVPAKQTTTAFTAHGPAGTLPSLTDPTQPPVDLPVGQYRHTPDRPSGTSGGGGVAFWKTLPVSSSGDQRLDWFQGNLFPESLTKDPVRLRKALRMMLANSVGIAYSERPGSGLRLNPSDSIDGFSAEDLRALTLFSGC
jgi:hypothetical protein